MKVNKEQFENALRSILKAKPITKEDVKGGKKAKPRKVRPRAQK